MNHRVCAVFTQDDHRVTCSRNQRPSLDVPACVQLQRTTSLLSSASVSGMIQRLQASTRAGATYVRGAAAPEPTLRKV